MKPKVSIIICAFNAEKFIEKSILSATAQSLKDIEILVVNDGSTDNTLQIILKIVEKDTRVFLIDHKNMGLGASRNIALTQAQGKYICFLDADDCLQPSFLKHLVDVLESNQMLNFVTSFPNFLSKITIEDHSAPLSSANNVKLDGSSQIMEAFYNRKLFAFGLYKKDFLNHHKIYFTEGGRYYEDVPFLFKAAQCANNAEIDSSGGYLYLLRNDSIMRGKMTRKKIDDLFFFLNIIRENSIQPLQLEPKLINSFIQFNYVKIISHYTEFLSSPIDTALESYYFELSKELSCSIKSTYFSKAKPLLKLFLLIDVTLFLRLMTFMKPILNKLRVARFNFKRL